MTTAALPYILASQWPGHTSKLWQLLPPPASDKTQSNFVLESPQLWSQLQCGPILRIPGTEALSILKHLRMALEMKSTSGLGYW